MNSYAKMSYLSTKPILITTLALLICGYSSSTISAVELDNASSGKQPQQNLSSVPPADEPERNYRPGEIIVKLKPAKKGTMSPSTMGVGTTVSSPN